MFTVSSISKKRCIDHEVKIGEAYQVLSNNELRKRYDKFGKEKAVPDSGFGSPITLNKQPMD